MWHSVALTCRAMCTNALTTCRTPVRQVSSRFAELRAAVGSIFIDEADLKHVRHAPRLECSDDPPCPH